MELAYVNTWLAGDLPLCYGEVAPKHKVRKVKTPSRRLIASAITIAAMATATSTHAAAVSYVLDQSNALANGVPYLQVTISDGASGAIDFDVQVLSSLDEIAGENFGIQAFAFNVAPGGDAEGANVSNLPDGWITRDGFRMANYGFFDIKLYGGGNSRLSTLTFSVDGVDGDTVSDYAVLSTGNASGDQQMFSAHVGDFQSGCEAGDKKCVTSAFFGGSSENAVPLPGAAWLFGAGLIGIVSRARQRRHAPR